MIAVFSFGWCRIRYGDLSCVDAIIVPYFLCTSWYSPLGFGTCVLLSWLTDKVPCVFYHL